MALPTSSAPSLEQLYDLVANEEDARSCRDLSEDACREVPRNFFVYLVAHVLTKLGDTLSNPKTVLTWVMATVGAPTALISLLVPIRESGSMIPQLALGAWVRGRPRRKPIWLAGSLLQAASILGCAAAAWFLSGAAAGFAILACVVTFSLARSLCSLSGKDILGKTIPKGRRGRLSGWSASVSGLLVLGVGIWFAVRTAGEEGVAFYVWLLAGAGSLWLLAAVVFGLMEEHDGETDGGVNGWSEAWGQLDLLRTDAPFRRFVLTRALLMCSALSAPFYVMLGREYAGTGASLLGSYLIAGGLASSLSAPIWGTLADRSSRSVMILAAILTGGLGIVLFVLVRSGIDVLGAVWFFPLFFLGLGVAHSGVRAGRKTYLVDLAGGTKRTDYVAISNTVIGILLLVAGGITSALSFLPAEVLVLGLSGMGLCGAGLAFALPEVE